MDSGFHRQFWLRDYLVKPLEGSVTTADGDIRHLQKKPMEVLVVLAEAQGSVVPGEQIIDRVWGNRSGGDEGLKRCIHAIRKVLEDTFSDPRMIRNVRGRGYACIPLPCFDDGAMLERIDNRERQSTPKVELEENRTITAVAVILSARDESGNAGEFSIPLDLMKDYLELLEKFENAHACDLGIMSTIIFGLDRTRDDDQLAALELSAALLESTNTRSNLGARVGIATDTLTVPTLEKFAKPVALNISVIRNAAGLAATARNDEISLCKTTAELCRGRGDAIPFPMGTSLLRLPDESGNGSGRRHQVRQVGRNSEFESLLSCWSRVSVGEGLVAYISGDVGIGKTSLCERLVKRIRTTQKNAVLECYSQPRSSHIPLHPIVRCITDSFGFGHVEDPAARPRIIEERVRQLGFNDPAAARVLAEFLGVEIADSPRMAELAPGVRHNLLIEVLSRALIQTSENPRLLVFEDIHWADSASLELLDQLIDRGPIARMMIVITGRTEMRPEWINHSHVTHLNLRELRGTECFEVIQQLNTEGVLDEDAIGHIIDAAAGNPLFLTEVTKSAIESNNPEARLGELLTHSVRQALLSRVDTLAFGKDVLRYASVIGPEFDLDSLQALTTESASNLERTLKALRNLNMVRRVSSYPKSTYSFAHGLLQAAVYESIPASTRASAHCRLAEYLETSSAGIEKEFLAYHFESGAQFEKSTRYWLQAANRAKQHSLFSLAQHLYSKALETLGKIEVSTGRDELEVQIRIEYGPVLMAQSGYAHEDVKSNYQQAERLTEILSDKGSSFLPQALFGLWTYRVVNGDLHLARALGEELQKLASRANDHELEMEARIMIGVTQTHMGNFDEALQELRCVIAIYDATEHAAHKFIFGQDPGMAAYIYCGVALGEMGEGEKAREYLDLGLMIARGSEHVPTLCFALTLTARHALAEGDLDTAKLHASESFELATTNGLPIWIGMSKFIINAADFAMKPETKLVERMAESRELCKQVGHFLSYLDFATPMAHAYLDLNDLDNAEIVLMEAKSEVIRRVKCAESESVISALQRLEELRNKTKKRREDL